MIYSRKVCQILLLITIYFQALYDIYHLLFAEEVVVYTIMVTIILIKFKEESYLLMSKPLISCLYIRGRCDSNVGI